MPLHWKQAIKRRLGEFHIPKPLIKELIGTNGVMNILTAIPIEEIIPKGIPYCRRGFDESSHQPQFDSFWDYFVKTWMVRYNPKVWNVYSFALYSWRCLLRYSGIPVLDLRSKLIV